MVARDLVTQGYRDVSEYKGGKQEWFDAKLPLEGEHPDEGPFPKKK